MVKLAILDTRERICFFNHENCFMVVTFKFRFSNLQAIFIFNLLIKAECSLLYWFFLYLLAVCCLIEGTLGTDSKASQEKSSLGPFFSYFRKWRYRRGSFPFPYSCPSQSPSTAFRGYVGSILFPLSLRICYIDSLNIVIDLLVVLVQDWTLS